MRSPSSPFATDHDTIVVGGGVVGLAIGVGLARAGERVCLLDEGDEAFRASRGNFGLVWVQGKGAGHVPYARWTLAAAAQWRAFAADLREASQVDVELDQPGGLTLCVEEGELRERTERLRRLAEALGEPYPFEVLAPAAVRALLPQAGGGLAGAVLSPLDGHLSPLRLLRALFAAFGAAGGRLVSRAGVERIVPVAGGGFICHTAGGPVAAAKVVLAAGLGNRQLAPQVGLHAPLRPVRGQVLVTGRMQPFLRHPTLHVRQTGEGTVQIGDSKEDAGFDEGTTLPQLARIAARAIRCFPCLAAANVVRTWGALRVMTPDGLPIYAESAQHAGAFLVTCHSGITLAPLHAGAIAQWIRGGDAPRSIRTFHPERFHVPAH